MEKTLKRENMVISWLMWHFYEVPMFLISVWGNYISFVSDFFSIPILIKTFISPWRRYKWRYPKGFNVGEFFSTLISNIFSRIIGAIFRFVLIILGGLAQIFTLTIGSTIFLLWVLIPFILIILISLLFSL